MDRAFHDMATSLDQQKQENEMFVYSVSHDLRSPLINLQGFSEELSLSYRELRGLFRHEEIPPAVRDDGLKLMTENIEDSIRYIQTAVGRLARIIDALLRLSRAGRVEYQWQTLDLDDDRPENRRRPSRHDCHQEGRGHRGRAAAGMGRPDRRGTDLRQPDQ